jgi:hypothetical protein
MKMKLKKVRKKAVAKITVSNTQVSNMAAVAKITVSNTLHWAVVNTIVQKYKWKITVANMVAKRVKKKMSLVMFMSRLKRVLIIKLYVVENCCNNRLSICS